ncbi:MULTISPECIES: rhomboid family intramembrane serine protease [Actinomycetes]|uniref:Rhomboid family intramembrane serine protease n=2 Tax=Actinomycetes TaxID=1760 RepID=A0ABP6LX85_9MICC
MRDISTSRGPAGEPQGRDSWGTLWQDARRHLVRTFAPVVVPVLAMWAVWLISIAAGDWFNRSFGLRPRTLDGLSGILFTPLLHSGFGHVMGNTMSWLLLGGLIALLVRRFLLVMTSIWLISGSLLWLIGRPASNWICNHPDGFDACITPLQVGASGVVYGFAAFLVAYGLMTRRVLAVVCALFVLFFQGISLILGMLPITSGQGVSWEGHLAGAVAGVVVAFFFTKQARADRAARA